MDRSSSPSSWPSDWPIQSDDPLRGWSLRSSSSSSKKKSAPGAAAADAGKRQNKNDAGLDDIDDEDDEGSSSGESGDDRKAAPGVGDDDEQEDEEDDLDHLLPGGILREMGTADVHWARGASTSASSSSTTQTKKYLVILPGLLSLTSNNTSKPTASGSNDDSGQQAPSTAAAATPQPASNPATALGRFKPPPMSLPQTDESGVATLELHDGSGGGLLRLEGRPVKTTGKFLWVTNLQKKKKTVTCKHVFDSVLVFGNATSIATTTANGTAGASATDVDAGDSKAAAADSGGASDDDDDDAVLVPPLHHYGASRRTVDGGNHLSGAAGAAMSTPKTPKANATPRASSAASRAAKHTPVSGKRSRKRTKVYDSDTDHSSQDGPGDRSSGSDDEDDDVSRGGAGATISSPVPPDSSIRRRSARASAQKPVRYHDQEEDEEESASDRETFDVDSVVASDLDDETARRRRVPEVPTVAARLPSPPLGRSRRRQQRDVVDLTDMDEGSGDEPRKTSAAKKRRLSNHETAVEERAEATEHGADESRRARQKTNDTGRSSLKEATLDQSTSVPAVQAPTHPSSKPTKAAVGQPHQKPFVDTPVAKALSGSPEHVKAGRRTEGDEVPNRNTPGSRSIEETSQKRRMSPAKPSDLEVAVMSSSSPSTPNGSSPRRSLPPTVRVRKTPRPKRKPMFILDYVKDEGFD